MNRYFRPLLFILIVLVQPVQAKLIEKNAIQQNHHNEFHHTHDELGENTAECHSGHFLAVLENLSTHRCRLQQVGYDRKELYDYSFISVDDPPPPKSLVASKITL